MYKIVEWNESLDLSTFYQAASSRGFVNNSSQKAMIDCFRNEKKWNAWILYQDDNAVGSVAAHSFDEIMGPNSFRILTRVCTFADARPSKGLITPKRLIAEHQNLTDQFFLPTCIEWAGKENLYSTSNNSQEASQRLVHNFYFPTLERIGIVEKVKDVYYRGTFQTVWKINADAFFQNLEKYPRWKLQKKDNIL
jgi:hypothetical protein